MTSPPPGTTKSLTHRRVRVFVIVLVALGYLVRPSLSAFVTTPAQTARVGEQVAAREDIRRAMKSGYRFSGRGLAVIARGTEAVRELANTEAGR